MWLIRNRINTINRKKQGMLAGRGGEKKEYGGEEFYTVCSWIHKIFKKQKRQRCSNP